MIHFKNIFYKNLLSVGNNGISVDLENYSKTLVIGSNGVGKSLLIDALHFALFGKPYKNIKKPEMVNAINQKELLVELEFTIGENSFFVRRGMNPGKFEIYKNGELLNQEASTKDYQKILEQIIGMNPKTFRQIVVLGASSYVPFMKLTTGDRRAVIENLLDIQIFTYMNSIAKGYLSELNDTYRELESDLKIDENSLHLKRNHLEEMKNRKNSYIQEHQSKVDELQSKNREIERELEQLNSHIESLDTSEKDELEQKKNKLSEQIKQLRNSYKKEQQQIDFFSNTENCPTCEQILDNEKAQEKISEHSRSLEEKQNGISKALAYQETIESKLQEISQRAIQKEEAKEKYKEKQGIIDSNNRYIENLEKQIEQLKNESDEEIEQEIQQLEEDYNTKKEKFDSTSNELLHYSTIVEMLKDSGIKSQIISNYIPILNRLIRKYLDIINFNVDFYFDEEFNETIKHRSRDEFSYSQLSAGEALRIDVVLLFAFRELAKVKNSASTNLLILDELGGSSLDAKGQEALMEILNNASNEGNSIFFIGHHNIADSQQYFDRVLEFSKTLHTSVLENVL